MELLGFQKAEIASDGRHLSLHVDTDQGAKVIEANAATLRTIVMNLFAALQKAESMEDNDAAIEAPAVIQSRIGPTPDGKTVLLGLRLETTKLAKATPLGPTPAFVLYTSLSPTGARETAEKLQLAASQCTGA